MRREEITPLCPWFQTLYNIMSQSQFLFFLLTQVLCLGHPQATRDICQQGFWSQIMQRFTWVILFGLFSAPKAALFLTVNAFHTQLTWQIAHMDAACVKHGPVLSWCQSWSWTWDLREHICSSHYQGLVENTGSQTYLLRGNQSLLRTRAQSCHLCDYCIATGFICVSLWKYTVCHY